MGISRYGIVPVVMVLAGCGGTPESGPTTEAKETLTVETPEFEVPAGDSFTCFYTKTITEKELTVVRASAKQGSGGHHVTVYYVDSEHPEDTHTCSDAEMASWHQIIGASAQGEPVVDVPEGLAFKVPANKQIVVQAHYINTTGATFKTKDSITIEMEDPKNIKAYANLWVLNDAAFKMDAHAPGSSVSTCTLAKDLDVVILFGHEHELGKHFMFERMDDNDNPVETLYETDWAAEYASHPPRKLFTMDKPLHFPAGMKVRQTCNWENTTPDPVTFPREMCVTLAYYYPDDGFQVCDSKHVK